VNPDDVEAQLRRAGRPDTPPERLQRAVLNLPLGSSPRPRLPSVVRLGVAAALALAVLAGASIVVTHGNPAIQPLATIQLRGGAGGAAEARIGNPNGPNRPLELRVQHLQPGTEQYYELWSYGEHPPMMLATFMTNRDGSCTIMLSVPRTADWQDLVITPRDRADQLLLCSNHGRC
jgi:hypothetical protein